MVLDLRVKILIASVCLHNKLRVNIFNFLYIKVTFKHTLSNQLNSHLFQIGNRPIYEFQYYVPEFN